MAIGVVRDGQLVLVRGHGHLVADRPIDRDAVFRIGSITKVVTTMAVLRLRDAGKLALDDPVARHLPELAAALTPEGQEPVRVRHLLQHTSGIPTLGDGSLDWTKGPPITEAQVLASVAKSELGFAPGTQHEYSNVGMAVAGLLVARASGTSYRDYVDRNLLQPLGMSDTRWQRDAYSADAVFPGHIRKGEQFVAPANYWNLGAVEPAGGLHSTLADMARFLSFQMQPDALPAVLSAASVAESHRRSERPAKNPMGLGWVVQKDPDLGKLVWHSGATYSYGAQVAIDPERKHGVIVLVATGDMGAVTMAMQLSRDMLRVLAGLSPKHTVKMKPEGQPTDPALVNQVGDRLLALFNQPEQARLEEVFSDPMRTSRPEATWRQLLRSVHDQAGTCQRHELSEDGGQGRFKLKLHCATMNLGLMVVAQPAPPHLIDGLQIQPAP